MFQVIANRIDSTFGNVCVAEFDNKEAADKFALASNCKPFTPYFFRVIKDGKEI